MPFVRGASRRMGREGVNAKVAIELPLEAFNDHRFGKFVAKAPYQLSSALQHQVDR